MVSKNEVPKQEQKNWGIHVEISGDPPDDATAEQLQQTANELMPQLIGKIAKANSMNITAASPHVIKR